MQQTEEHLIGHEIRPRFKVETSLTIEELVMKIDTKLKEENALCKGHIFHGYAKLYALVEEEHFWSPHLTITFENIDNQTVIRGLYGPRATVWTMFVFFYALLSFVILIVLIIGLSYWSLGKSTYILWWIPVLSAILGSLYFIAYSGQQLGKDEILTIHHFLEESTGLSI
ncbi:MAG: hypothetical protein AB8G11_00580 [Saprospiraceae bacterium]